jgi:hypothetical protein
VAGEVPYPTVELLRQLAEGKKRRSGGVASGQSMAMAAAEELGALGFFRWKAAAAAWGERARAWGLNRVAGRLGMRARGSA